MSRGLGHIERAIVELFRANPDAAYSTTDLCLACYSTATKAQRVAVTRAANRLWNLSYDRAELPGINQWARDPNQEAVWINRYSALSAQDAFRLRSWRVDEEDRVRTEERAAHDRAVRDRDKAAVKAWIQVENGRRTMTNMQFARATGGGNLGLEMMELPEWCTEEPPLPRP
jgi:hypothetical protein